MLVRDVIIEYTKKLEKISSTPRLDIEVLIMHILEYENKIDLMMNYDKKLDELQISKLMDMVDKRIKSMPIAYIVNKKEFMGLDFFVNENVLIPRPDTEIIVEDVIDKTIDIIKNTSEDVKILDMCVGSGAIILSIASILKDCLTYEEYNRISFYGADISNPALEVANKNKINLGVENVELIQSDLFDSELFNDLEGTLNIIVSNPPYIEKSVIDMLSTDVKDYEPILALVGGDDGMMFYNKIIDKSTQFLKKEGLLFFESGHNQAKKIRVKMLEKGFCEIFTKADLQGFERLVCGKYPKTNLL